MPKFVDRKGREWLLDLDVYLVEQIHKRTDVRIDRLVADTAAGVGELFGDAVLLVRVLWVMVEEQAVRLSPPVTAEAFGRSLAGDSLEAAAKAFLETLADFSPSQQRRVLKALLARGAEVAETQTEAALAEIAAFRLPSSTPATTAAASSDSTPAPAG